MYYRNGTCILWIVRRNFEIDNLFIECAPMNRSKLASISSVADLFEDYTNEKKIINQSRKTINYYHNSS